MTGPVPSAAVPSGEGVPGTPFWRAADDGAEGRLIAAYAALSEGQGRAAFDLAAALVRDHPGFSLAQLLYADLLAARAGWPAVFGVDAQQGHASPPAPASSAGQGLREEAIRRLAALRERPVPGSIPAEFVRLAPSVRHAVAVDASRSRLYLFSNSEQGLRLERDFYVSLGKQGIDKFIEGDRRTPLGVYWITAALPKSQLDGRFGHGALRFNYPNAVDRQQGRTGRGLFLHGVPTDVMNHVPWATDGCVAMANADVEDLLRKLDVDATPVVIARELSWVAPEAVRQAAAEFDPAWRAWSSARQTGEPSEFLRWYLPGAAQASSWKPTATEREHSSLLAWRNEGVPMMVVTSHAYAQGPSPTVYRQYWTRRDNQWRIAFEGSVSLHGDLASLARGEPAEERAGAPAEPATVVATRSIRRH